MTMSPLHRQLGENTQRTSQQWRTHVINVSAMCYCCTTYELFVPNPLNMRHSMAASVLYILNRARFNQFPIEGTVPHVCIYWDVLLRWISICSIELSLALRLKSGEKPPACISVQDLSLHAGQHVAWVNLCLACYCATMLMFCTLAIAWIIY